MFSFVLMTGTSGLVKASFDFRIYDRDTALVDNGFTVTPLSTGVEYAIEGLPDSPGVQYTLTWELSGVFGSKTWPELEATAPDFVVIPIRTTGLLIGDLGLALFKDEADDASVLTVAEIGSPGDYSVTGWDVEDPGRWFLRWKIGPFSYFRTWEVSAGSSTWRLLRDAIDTRIDRAFAFAEVIEPGITTRKGLRNQKNWSPSAAENAIRGYYRLATTDRLGANNGFDRTLGTIFLQIFVKNQVGDDLWVDLADAVEPAFLTEGDGLNFEEAPKPIDPTNRNDHFVGVASFPFHQDNLS